MERKINNWNKEEFGHIMRDQQQLRNKMENIQKQILSRGRV